MRALWSARVSTSPNVSITAFSTDAEQVSSRHAERTSCAAVAVSPCAARAREREFALCRDRLGADEEGTYRIGAAPFVPERALGALADHGRVWPARVF